MTLQAIDDKLKRKLLGLKKVKIYGHKFVIKKINPLLDFNSNSIPKIFSSINPKRLSMNDRKLTDVEIKNAYENMETIIEAGLYYPKLTKQQSGENKWHEKGLTVKDLFIDDELGYKLYIEILSHSLNKFKGIVGSFFLNILRRWLYIQLPQNRVNSR